VAGLSWGSNEPPTTIYATQQIEQLSSLVVTFLLSSFGFLEARPSVLRTDDPTDNRWYYGQQMVQRTDGPTDRRSNGQMVQRTDGPPDRWSNGLGYVGEMISCHPCLLDPDPVHGRNGGFL